MLNHRSKISEDVARLLVHNPNLGGGNILQSVLEVSSEPDTPWLLANRPLRDIDGEECAEFSLNNLNRLVESLAVWYWEKGVRSRDRVAIYLDDSFEDIVHLFALSRIGAIAVLLNGRLPLETALGLCQRTQPVGIYTDEHHLQLIQSGLQDISAFLRWVCAARDMGVLGVRTLPSDARYQHHDEDPIVICHSSGTTGNPKPVIWTHGQSIAGPRYRLSSFTERPGIIMLLAVPHSHTGAVGFTFYALLANILLVAISDPRAHSLVTAIECYKPTTVVAFSASYAELASNISTDVDLSSVRHWINMGDSAHHAHVMTILRNVPNSAFGDGLGSSELGWGILRRLYTLDAEPVARLIGEPEPLADVAVLREDGTLADQYEVGLLGVKSPTLTPGYWNDSDTNYRSRLMGYWLSGDLVYRDKQNQYYHIDRAVDAIRTPNGNGYSVLMEETLLLTLPEISDCAIVAGWDGTKVVPVAVVKCHQKTKAEDLLIRANEALRSSGQLELAVLDIAQSEADIPVGATGKVLKSRLREKYNNLANRNGFSATGAQNQTGLNDGRPHYETI